MKKLMIALSAATLVVLGAKAANPTTLGAIEGFEGRPAGALDVTKADDNSTDGTKYWSRAKDKTGDSVVAEYKTPAEGNAKYLKVDETDVLTRDIGGDTSIPANGGNITISTKVQFTAADEAPTAADDDKLLVWMQAAAEAEGTEGTEGYKPAKKNGVMVTDRAGATMIKEVTDVETFTAAWHDLVIKAVAAGTENQPSAGFTITLDGVEYGTDTPFASRVVGGDKAQTISSIGFQGTGAVDDIGFVANEVEEIPEVQVSATVATGYTVAVRNGGDVEIATAKVGDVVKIVVTKDDGDFAANTTVTAEDLDFAFDDNEGGYVATYEVTESDGTAGAKAFTVTVVEGAPEPSFTPAQEIVVGNMSKYYQSGKTEADAGCYATVGTIADGVDFTVTVGETVVAADATFDVSVGNNVMMTTKYFVVEEGTVKVANVILAVEDVTLTVGGNTYELSQSPNGKLTKGAVAFTGGKSTADATTDGYLLTVDSSHDILALNFANQTKDTFYITKKTYCWGAAYENQMAVSYGITPADNDNGALWLYPVGWTEDGSVPNYYFGEGMYLDYMIAVGNASAQVRLTYAKPGPQEWSDVTDDNLDKVVELPTGSTVGADAVKQWANDNSVKFEAGVKIPVNALIFNVAPIDAPKEETEKAAADTVLAEVIAEAAKAKVDLEALLKQAAGAGADGLTVTSLATKYPMAVIKLVPATVIESSDNAKFFQLSITLK